MSSVKAVILAAGKGTRLNSLSMSMPKPMLPLGDHPVIGHLLNLLATSGVEEVFMNLHHQPEALRAYCGNGSRWGLRITYALERELLGTAGAVRNFSRHLGKGPFFVVYGDNYLKCDLAAVWKYHEERRGLATIALFEKGDVTGSGVVQVDDDGRVLRFAEKPHPSEAFSRLVNGGLYVLSPFILPLIPDYVPCDFGFHLFPALLASGYSIYGQVMEGEVWPVDTPELYRMACTRMAKEPGLKR